MKRIVIQGYPGAFHEVAARRFWQGEPLDIVPAATFDDLVRLAECPKTADAAVMAIENTIAGSILKNYKLLNDSKLEVVGEVFLRIRQNLLALPGSRIEDLREVHSHPMALLQCEEFFKNHPAIRLVESADTALSARQLRENGDPAVGAIASIYAAELFELNVLAEGIESFESNFTRFLVLERRNGAHRTGGSAVSISSANGTLVKPTAAQKVSLRVETAHEPGSLNRVLQALAGQGANLTKIQSVPDPANPFHYFFFMDYLLPDASQFEASLVAIRPWALSVNVLGNYQPGKMINDER